MNTTLSQLVAQIKLNLGRKRLTAKIPYSNQNFNILKILYHEGYIRGFKVTESSTKIFVFLKLNNFRSSFLDIAYFCPKNRHSHLTYKKLIRFYGLKHFGIVSTNLVYLQ